MSIDVAVEFFLTKLSKLPRTSLLFVAKTTVQYAEVRRSGRHPSGPESLNSSSSHRSGTVWYTHSARDANSLQ